MGRRPAAWWWERAKAGAGRQARGPSASGRETRDTASYGEEAGGNRIRSSFGATGVAEARRGRCVCKLTKCS
ncbi:hypothetical protein E2562_004125 [Oryza meyeriana var. granulata]|uniref:Uncharacterized protein n=1 Tax=Oryza meyeriana var. granulata TaxID=110450 RepID=A0A6G1EV25_9ORYZ|nr:hypothetical protein E2562_004125 [Oryza meyeriana var. granulata]